ncbi:MAG TPA: hypothetical protein VLC93_08615 [Myxococcota bacterium]|nr:hypothetical protein [Myxococcota bacterium]
MAFGTTALVVVVNPRVNDANQQSVPPPASERSGVRLSSDDGVSATTDDDGIAVLAPLDAGVRVITVSGDNTGGTFQVTMEDGALREVAVAARESSTEIMANLDYTTDNVTELTPSTSLADVNAALAVSDTVVFFRGGVYEGDLTFSGSRVTLFGEGALGGNVELRGNVTVSGSNSRIRGALITGNLALPASGVGLSFSRVNGSVTAGGSDVTLLGNALCGSETITGSDALVIGNAGAAPTTQCP